MTEITSKPPENEIGWETTGLGASMLSALSEGIPASRLWSLLMGVAKRRASKRTCPDLLQQWQSDRFVAPAYVDTRAQLEFDRHLFAVAESFEAIELSPVAPLGVCSVVAPGSQNRIVSTMRGTEVVSDPTNIMALESARRLRLDASTAVRLATSHRCVRAQAFQKGPGMAAHFRLFCLSSAGHETKDHNFIVTALTEHLQFHLGAFAHLQLHGYQFNDVSVILHSAPARNHLVDRIAATLRDVSIATQHLESNYYDGLRFTVSATTSSGEQVMLSDGGAFDWVGKLAANRKLSFVASAMGSQRAALLFRT